MTSSCQDEVVTGPTMCAALCHKSGRDVEPVTGDCELTFIGKGMTPPQKTLSPPEKIYMDWRQKRRPGAGLYNLGSTCYLNVILQCLTYTPPLANYLLSRQHSRFCDQQGFCMMCIMEDHVRKVLYSSATAIRPRAVIRDLKFIGEFKPDIPGDAYEFLRCTLNAMHRACLRNICSSIKLF
uniref:Ubiquitin carboxyl-terminal hydrolase 36 n=1 Tax=Serinus canaria TaxID=9135 RepID=A0A8C9N6B4_SERCA